MSFGSFLIFNHKRALKNFALIAIGKTNTLKYSSSAVNITVNNSRTKNDISLPNNLGDQEVSQEITISRSMSNLFKVSKIKLANEDNSKCKNHRLKCLTFLG